MITDNREDRRAISAGGRLKASGPDTGYTVIQWYNDTGYTVTQWYNDTGYTDTVVQ